MESSVFPAFKQQRQALRKRRHHQFTVMAPAGKVQGMFGAALVPLSQATLLDIYPPERRGFAMAIWGVGVMLGPIMGPSLGAWLTETYSWHWVFFVNLPFGIVTVLGLMAFMDETKQNHDLRFDWFGFGALAIGIGSMQLALDRGNLPAKLRQPRDIVRRVGGGRGTVRDGSNGGNHGAPPCSCARVRIDTPPADAV